MEERAVPKTDESDTSTSPLIVVMGTTGAGKTKLAIEIAKSIGGEVVSADSMQLYRGLDVATNKVTPAEMEGVPHHMIDILDPLETEFSVSKFVAQAIPIISDIHRRGKVPILVGGWFETCLQKKTSFPYRDSLLHRIYRLGGQGDRFKGSGRSST